MENRNGEYVPNVPLTHQGWFHDKAPLHHAEVEQQLPIAEAKELEVQLHSQGSFVAGRRHCGDTQNCWIPVETEKNKQKKYFRPKMGYKTPLARSHLLLRTGRSPNTLTVCCPSLQRLHRGSLHLAAAAPLQPFLMMAKSFTSRKCGSHCYYTRFTPVSPELWSFFVWAVQAIFFSSAANRLYLISALHLGQRRIDRELPSGIE